MTSRSSSSVPYPPSHIYGHIHAASLVKVISKIAESSKLQVQNICLFKPHEII
jgi:hypothetical protein